MASDSAAWEDDTLAHKAKKIYRLSDGSVAGIYGTLEHCMNLLRYIEDPTLKLNLQGASAIVVRPSLRVVAYNGTVAMPIIRAKYLAAGSGMSVALGACFQGATAVEAVKAAIAHDSGSRGPVVSMKVKK